MKEPLQDSGAVLLFFVVGGTGKRCGAQLACQLLGAMDQDGQTLRADRERLALEAQGNEGHLLFRTAAIQALPLC